MSSSMASVLRTDRKLLIKSAGMALILELAILLALSLAQGEWFFGRHKSVNPDDYVEAQVMQLPREAHLTSQQPTVIKAPSEAVISKVAGQGKKAKPEQAKQEEQNQTQSGPQLGATHGPVAIYAPAPVIPAYLRERDLHTSAVIEFFVDAQGAAIPRLINSSGDEELDAIALATVQKWQFRPAEKDHKPLEAKVRLRIVFEVQ